MANKSLDVFAWCPVGVGLVYELHHYAYSSAVDYYIGQKGLVKVVRMEQKSLWINMVEVT